MDPFEELERMAQNASALNDPEPDEEDIERWVKLFKYDYLEAYALLKAQRSDVTRDPISDEHWGQRRTRGCWLRPRGIRAFPHFEECPQEPRYRLP